MKNETEQLWDYLEETGIATNDELKLVSSICGYSLESMESVLFAKTGYRSLGQITGEDDE